VAEALSALSVYAIGKPLVIEEMFPLKCSIDELGKFIDGSRRLAQGWVSFYWGTTIAQYETKEKPTPADILTRKWLAYFRAKSTSVVSHGSSR
jgi:hypothetical protein